MNVVKLQNARIVARVWTLWLALLGLAAALAWAGPAAAQGGDAATDVLRERVISLRAAGDPQSDAGSTALRAAIAGLYERRGAAPLWRDADRVRRLQSALAASASHGLDPRDYHRGALAALQVPDADGAARNTALAQRDLLLTDAFVRFAYHLSYGKVDPRTLSRGWNFARRPSDTEAFAALAAHAEDADPAAALDGFAPASVAYRSLRAALADLLDVQRAGGWPAVDKGAKLEFGATGPRVAQLHARLRAQGYAVGDTAVPDRYDADLAAAVRRFQTLHGLEPDGVVGRETLAALNVGVDDRIAQVGVNLERLRWLARDMRGDYLAVDIAAFDAQLWLDDALAWSARAVVGRPYRKTPEFRARMQTVVINPEWHVPPTILREDVLPKLAQDPAYLAQHHMRLVDAQGRTVDAAGVDWPTVTVDEHAFPYQVVQAAGADNALGRLKFLFPNEHTVYLHDTPARELFQRTRRAYSSGCIRVDNPLRLAELLLDDQRRWSQPQLEAAIESGRTQFVPVRRAVPMLLLYFTARAESDGLHFDADLYGRDRPIARALAAPARFGT